MRAGAPDWVLNSGASVACRIDILRGGRVVADDVPCADVRLDWQSSRVVPGMLSFKAPLEWVPRFPLDPLNRFGQRARVAFLFELDGESWQTDLGQFVLTDWSVEDDGVLVTGFDLMQVLEENPMAWASSPPPGSMLSTELRRLCESLPVVLGEGVVDSPVPAEAQWGTSRTEAVTMLTAAKGCAVRSGAGGALHVYRLADGSHPVATFEERDLGWRTGNGLLVSVRERPVGEGRLPNRWIVTGTASYSVDVPVDSSGDGKEAKFPAPTSLAATSDKGANRTTVAGKADAPDGTRVTVTDSSGSTIGSGSVSGKAFTVTIGAYRQSGSVVYVRIGEGDKRSNQTGIAVTGQSDYKLRKPTGVTAYIDSGSVSVEGKSSAANGTGVTVSRGSTVLGTGQVWDGVFSVGVTAAKGETLTVVLGSGKLASVPVVVAVTTEPAGKSVKVKTRKEKRKDSFTAVRVNNTGIFESSMYGWVTQVTEFSGTASQDDVENAADDAMRASLSALGGLTVEVVPDPRVEVGDVVSIVTRDWVKVGRVSAYSLPLSDVNSTMRLDIDLLEW